uniref:hypothetical protein n=1 Tax=Enterobacter sp. TaxID=42895 RepID=UPI00296F1FE8|nr:hypothetical protein [Enterobacter sp.]
MSANVIKTDDGYVIYDDSGWLPGLYESSEAAELALKQKHLENWGRLQRLQDESDGRITLEQLNE